jgi:hypothetical protein
MKASFRHFADAADGEENAEFFLAFSHFLQLEIFYTLDVMTMESRQQCYVAMSTSEIPAFQMLK